MALRKDTSWFGCVKSQMNGQTHENGKKLYILIFKRYHQYKIWRSLDNDKNNLIESS